jgi:DNA-binding transcriptional LysR family regulator
MRFCMGGASSLDWSLVQAFLAVVERGSLSAAARMLGLSQPTLGRQIKAMEEQLGAELFHRRGHGLELTPTGTSLLPSAQAMRAAAHGIELAGTGANRAIEGTVRITASVAVAVHHLPAIVVAIRQTEPGIAIEIVPSDETSNLHFREADIAVRMYRPTQLDLVTAHVGDLEIGVFAAKGYVARRGVPRTPEEFLHHDFVGMDRGTQIIEGFRRAGFPVERDWFMVRADDFATHLALIRAGAGIGFVQKVIGASAPELVEIPVDIGLPLLPLWLTAHEAVRGAPRVSRVWDLLASALRDACRRDVDRR